MEGVPFLRVGKGSDPEEGGCILQVIDWIDRGKWTDTPRCVLPQFREMAINCNDGLDDNERQGLLDLAPRLRGTAYAPTMDKYGINEVIPLTKEQLLYNRRAELWMRDWMESHGSGDKHSEYGYDYLRRLSDALDAYEQRFGSERPNSQQSDWDWEPIYNYLREFELNGEFDRYMSDAGQLTQIRVNEDQASLFS